MKYAPVVLFTYNRPNHTLETLNALKENNLISETDLYIYCDAPKISATTEDVKNNEQVKKIISEIDWAKQVHYVIRETNFGLANNIIDGVTNIINTHGTVIVLEDDIITSKYFLKFMNDALNLYEKENKVLSIGAYNYFTNKNDSNETLFIRTPDTWGWATWKDRWALYEPDGSLLMKQLKENKLLNRFNLDGAFCFERMLDKQIKGLNSSWAIRWQALATLKDTLTLYPKYSLTKNIGFDDAGTHTTTISDSIYKNNIFTEEAVKVEKIKIELKEDNYQLYCEATKKVRNSPLPFWLECITYKFIHNYALIKKKYF